IEKDPTHIYQAAGNYTVILTVVDSDGDSDTEIKQEYIIVVEPEEEPEQTQKQIPLSLGPIMVLLLAGIIIALLKSLKNVRTSRSEG
ncbi:MAG: PKD domain-containing protein, partial [Promethearchaeota archaeon]